MLTPTKSGNAGPDDSAIFPAEPPPWVARALAWMLIALFLTALIASIAVRVPETVDSPFVLVSKGGADPIQAPRAAVVHQVLISEGQSVKRGDTLFVLSVDQVREWRAETDAREQALRTAQETSRKLEEAHVVSLRMKDAEIAQARRETAFRAEHLRLMRDLLQRAEKLATSGLISDMELTSHRLGVTESQKDLEQARKTLVQEIDERGALETERARQRIAERSAAEESMIRISSLKQPLTATSSGLLEVRAPYDAVVLDVMPQNGRVVAPGDALCQLTAPSRHLQARLLMAETGLAKIEPQQRVRLRFDAYPYQRYGVVDGVVDWISPAAVEHEEGADFVVVATVNGSEIRSRGTTLPLRPGMRGQARITVGRRALIEYVLEPLRQVRENLQP